MKTITLMILSLTFCNVALAENIDPYSTGEQYAWSENCGWLNFKDQWCDVHVSSSKVEGFLWAENIGWINLSPENYGGVLNDGAGSLSGYAWAENVGWINFNPIVPGIRIHYGVTIDSDGKFSGYAWGENIGWIRFDGASTSTVRTCMVGLEDLNNLAEHWLTSDSAADLDSSGNTDNRDLGIFSSYWFDYCPDNWQLK